jgi:hypothetical protein
VVVSTKLQFGMVRSIFETPVVGVTKKKKNANINPLGKLDGQKRSPASDRDATKC